MNSVMIMPREKNKAVEKLMKAAKSVFDRLKERINRPGIELEQQIQWYGDIDSANTAIVLMLNHK